MAERPAPPGKSAAAYNTTLAILEHWERDRPGDRLAHLVRDLSRCFTRALQLRLADFDVSFGHWMFLRALWKKDGVTQRELSITVGLMEPTTHTALIRMEELGYVVRRRKDGNRRKHFIYLTDEGKALEEKLVPLAEEVNRIAADGVDADAMAVIRTGLLRMVKNLAEDEAAALAAGRSLPSTRSLGQRV
ncbi:MarR family winged helix-turn-helix transcriptional regulator [Oceanibacterium hippocampi]|uniref:Organic hydroperoxide resistance transcriptional regulator n=1 Tax=Oceanibacterium hippocampi TaxID=745714 RepID=A0A1Y5U2R4_9PROT|nr:MarR family transcriptional regulator [Oceanibacterium hippocampi]SLN75754.1 Organic hydroperoxide resistance transcriptional regulator [Oceanibacterium hippocampi]